MTTESAGLWKVRTLVFKAWNNKFAAKWTLETESQSLLKIDTQKTSNCFLQSLNIAFGPLFWPVRMLRSTMCISLSVSVGRFFCLPNCTCRVRGVVSQPPYSGLSWCCHWKDLSSLCYACLALLLLSSLSTVVSRISFFPICSVSFLWWWLPQFSSLQRSKKQPPQLEEKSRVEWAFHGCVLTLPWASSCTSPLDCPRGVTCFS